MNITDEQIEHFHRQGFFLVPNPLGEEKMHRVDAIQRRIEAEWAQTDWPEGLNRLACQLFMVGEPVLQLIEQPDLVDAARLWTVMKCISGPAGWGTPPGRLQRTDGPSVRCTGTQTGALR